jgi:hypothetical protein
MKKGPTSLLEHRAKIDADGERFKLIVPRPERMRDLGNIILGQLQAESKRTLTKKAMQEILRSETAEGAVAHDAMWLKAHSSSGLKIIEQFPQEHRKVLRRLWAYAFSAGERYSSAKANVRYLKDVQVQSAIKAGLVQATQIRQEKHPPKITIEKFAAAIAKQTAMKKESDRRSGKVFAGILDVTPQAVRDFKRKHADEIAKLGT